MSNMIEVGPHKIRYGHKPFVIAEVGSNFSNLEDCMTSITQAKKCGADAVKFQAYNYQSLYGKELIGTKTTPVLKDGQLWHFTEYDTVCDMPGTLTLEWLQKLKEKADAVGIEFMCSAFSPELLDAVNPFVRIHKLASSEMCHVRMLEKLREYGKPVFMSMAGQHPEDIYRAMTYLTYNANAAKLGVVIGDVDLKKDLVLMYCVGGYPSNRYNPRAISDLKSLFPDVMIGLSDHSREVYLSAYRQDAAVIEKHVNFVGSTGPDAPHSLNAEEFKDFVAGLTALPEWTGPTKEESAFITRHKRRLIATRDIVAGETLIDGENFGIYRSLKDDAHAFSPWMVEEVNGMTAKRSIEAGTGIGPGDV